MQDVNIPDNAQPDMVGEYLAAASAARAQALRDERAAITEDYALGFEWTLADAALADENAALRLVIAQYRRGTPVIAWLESQLAHERKRAHAAEARAVAAERENLELIAERDLLRRENQVLRAQLDAAEVLASDEESFPAAVRLDRASERPHYNMAPPRRTPPAA